MILHFLPDDSDYENENFKMLANSFDSSAQKNECL